MTLATGTPTRTGRPVGPAGGGPVDWGDGTPPTPATVTESNGSGTIKRRKRGHS